MKALHKKDFPRGTENILVVDDDRAILKLLKMVLESLGYEATCESCPKAALARFTGRPQHYDLVITDYEMLPLNGFQLASSISRMRPDIPILAHTGSPARAYRHTIFRNVMEKPISLKGIAVTIRQALDYRLLPPDTTSIHPTISTNDRKDKKSIL